MKFVSVFCLWLVGGIGLLYAAPPPPAKKKAAAPAAAKSTAKKPVATRKATAATASRYRKPTASSRAIYSRSNSRRGCNSSARAAAAAAKVPSNWQARPSQERYTEIQQALAEKGFFKGEANGTWGADSVSALKEFQRSQNLEPDGKLGSLSLIALGMGPKRIVASTLPGDTQGALAAPPTPSQPAPQPPPPQQAETNAANR